jgi:hypothetical protein
MAAIIRQHYKLNWELIKKVRILAEFGGPLEHIAAAVGVSYPAIRVWISNAKKGQGTELELALLSAIDLGRATGGMRLANIIAKAADEGNTRDAQWMLTHSPAFRNHYSDNAAIVRARQEGIELAVQALTESELSPEQERNLLLRIQSKTGERLVDVEDS